MEPAGGAGASGARRSTGGAGSGGSAGDARVVLSQVRRTLADRRLVPRCGHVLVGCSGGPDSAALLCALAELSAELELRVTAASVDHGLRSGSDRDVALARAQAEQLGVAFHPLKVQVEPGPSRQAQARKARYRALQALARELGAARIAVGHTQNDQAETVLLRMLRGSGLRGLAAIEPLRADGVMRPLIDCRRVDVHAFAARSGLPLADDPSNADRGFARVRVRQQLMPLIEREDRRASEHLSQLAEEARELAAWLDGLATQARAQIAVTPLGPGGEGGRTLDVSTLAAAPAPLRRTVLRSLLSELTGCASVGRAHLEGVEHALAHGGLVWLPGGWSVSRTAAGHLLVTIQARHKTQ